MAGFVEFISTYGPQRADFLYSIHILKSLYFVWKVSQESPWLLTYDTHLKELNSQNQIFTFYRVSVSSISTHKNTIYYFIITATLEL